jgi:hypothetical protein
MLLACASAGCDTTAICLEKGQVVPATDADHIVPHKGNEWAFWYGDLQSLCGSQVHGISHVVHYAELANRRFSVEALL